MPRTYSQLKATVLTLCDESGSTDAGAVVEVALLETLKYIATQVEVPGLTSSAQATWGAATTSLSITSDFNISDFASANRLYVKKDSTSEDYGTPYDFVEFLHWHDLKSVPNNNFREYISTPARLDERPLKSWTLGLDQDDVFIDPIAENNVVTLFYNKEPAAYADGGYPEIGAKWDYLLVAGASLVLQYWLREPDIIIDHHSIIAGIDPLIAKYDSELNTRRKRDQLKISHRYRIV